MGWLWLAGFAAAAAALLVLLGVRRSLWSFVGAALMLGAAGYAWQGRPTLAAAAPAPQAEMLRDDPAMTKLRDDMFGRFTLDAAYLIAADAMSGRGDERSAVRVLLGGIGKAPRSYALWTALGTAYTRHDGGQISPAARFAFDQARRLAPDQPAPPFFEGLAYVRLGDFAKAQPLWRRALTLAPPTRSYRSEIATRLELLDQLVAMQAAMPPVR